MADKQAVLGNGAKFTGKITNAKSIEINGVVQADLVTEKVTIGNTGNFKGAVKSDLVVIAGEYEGKMKADSIWLTESSRISGEIHYKSLQMDRGAALNCRVVHNWDKKELKEVYVIIPDISLLWFRVNSDEATIEDLKDYIILDLSNLFKESFVSPVLSHKDKGLGINEKVKTYAGEALILTDGLKHGLKHGGNFGVTFNVVTNWVL